MQRSDRPQEVEQTRQERADWENSTERLDVRREHRANVLPEAVCRHAQRIVVRHVTSCSGHLAPTERRYHDPGR